MWNDEESREVFSAIQEGGRRATQLLKAYVKEGNADAMVVLALRKKTSAEDTVALLRQAAKQGHRYAQLHLGLEYIRGANIRKHRSSGLKLITESADQGCNFAAMWLAEHYLEGDDPERDDKNGIRLLKQVANSQEYQPCIHFKEIEACDSFAEYVQLREGYAIAVAQENLAVMYESGLHGLPEDSEQAVFWLAKLYACGLTDIAWDLVALYKKLGNNDQVEPILEALVKRDDPDAMVELARLLEQSPNRNNRTDPYNLRLRARKLAAAATHPSPTPPVPPSPPSAYSGERDRSFRPIVTVAHEMVLRG